MIKEHGKIQVAAEKNGKPVVFDLKVFERKVRKTRKLFAETQCYDTNHYIIQFFVKDADSVEEIVQRFCKQLAHRGFEPMRLRFLKRGWGPWKVLSNPE